ncbi:MAG: AAA family ATPase [Phycisphaeraceae bacterium]
MSSADLLPPDRLEPAARAAGRLLEELDAVLLGQGDLNRLVLVGILSRGHILLEGLPGVGKTQLVKTLSELMRLDFSRVQFTPDLMPGDILGTHILQENAEGRREMNFEPGPIFSNLVLADEINRASPKTQAALLEAMQERCVTLLNATRPLPDPFFVLASQNPIELEGTYPLPEAQLDRFLFKLHVGGANIDVLEQIISSRRRGEPPKPDWSLSREQLEEIFQVMEGIYLPRALVRYIARLVAATHSESNEATPLVTQYVTYGASARAAIAIAEAARGHALLDARPTVGFEDVHAVAVAVMNHRIILNYKARFDQVDTTAVIRSLLEALDPASLDLPDDVQISSASTTQSPG